MSFRRSYVLVNGVELLELSIVVLINATINILLLGVALWHMDVVGKMGYSYTIKSSRNDARHLLQWGGQFCDWATLKNWFKQQTHNGKMINEIILSGVLNR